MIDTEKFSETLRAKAIDTATSRLLVSRIQGSNQEEDLKDPPNCGGYGRVRHFRRETSAGWPSNPLPIDPAARRLGLNSPSEIRAQVFQNAACNWRCWYCFVPFDLLSANPLKAGWLSADEMVELYQKEENAPLVIDLSGGQPDLTPEWVPWMMRSLIAKNLHNTTYLWSDDNLSNDYLWKYLTSEDLKLIRGYKNYGKVCCFKGFSAESFAFNTAASPDLFENQFRLFQKLLDLGIDLYGYSTFTSPNDAGIPQAMGSFVDRLQAIHPNLPLRVVPLEITAYPHMRGRMKEEHDRAILIQQEAISCWNSELERRFPGPLRRTAIYDVPIYT